VDALSLIWLLVMVWIFYLLLVRPQRRRMAAHRELMADLNVGDEVMTMGGLFGRIKHMDDEVVALEIAPGTSVRVARSAISRKVSV
jgi:preprotein translocase subunit YajC